MGRKKAKTQPKKKKIFKIEKQFDCLYCNNEKTIEVKM